MSLRGKMKMAQMEAKMGFAAATGTTSGSKTTYTTRSTGPVVSSGYTVTSSTSPTIVSRGPRVVTTHLGSPVASSATYSSHTSYRSSGGVVSSGLGTTGLATGLHTTGLTTTALPIHTTTAALHPVMPLGTTTLLDSGLAGTTVIGSPSGKSSYSKTTTTTTSTGGVPTVFGGHGHGKTVTTTTTTTNGAHPVVGTTLLDPLDPLNTTFAPVTMFDNPEHRAAHEKALQENDAAREAPPTAEAVARKVPEASAEAPAASPEDKPSYLP